tara:strand:- start:14210 stop:14671 length:462 start_codon:yes stop_codon:yes gene_type:complete
MLLKKILINQYYFFKNLLLIFKGASIGRGVKIYGKIIVKYPKNLIIGDNCTLNDGVLLNCKGGIVIGDNCRISSNAQFYSTGLTIDKFPRIHHSSRITLENNVWIGSNSVITQGVRIGQKSTLGALSLANKNIEPYSFYAGTPAKKIKDITEV